MQLPLSPLHVASIASRAVAQATGDYLLEEGFRAAFLGKPFDPVGLWTSLAVSVVVFVFAVAYFEKVERRFADII